MDRERELIRHVTEQVIRKLMEAEQDLLVPVGISNRHVHLDREDMDALFGPGSELTVKKTVKQPGQFAAEQTVTLTGPRGESAIISGVTNYDDVTLFCRKRDVRLVPGQGVEGDACVGNDEGRNVCILVDTDRDLRCAAAVRVGVVCDIHEDLLHRHA